MGHYAVAPFLLGTLAWSTYYFETQANEELVAKTRIPTPPSPPTEPDTDTHTHTVTTAADDRAQVLGLFSLYRYLELSTDGPRFDTSPLATLIDWPKLMSLAPTRPALGMVYYAWSTLLNGIDNTVALFPSVDIKPKLIRLGILDSLEGGLASANPTVRLCAAYVVNRLVKNTQVARLVAGRPKIVREVVEILEEEMVVSETSGRFQGFVHSESNTSAEVFVTLLETLNCIVEAGVGNDTLALVLAGGGGGGSQSDTDTHTQQQNHSPAIDSHKQERASIVLSQLSPQLINKLTTMLHHMELCDEHVTNAKGLFRDHHMVVYQKFFPHAVDDQVRRRMREVEAEVARFLSAVSKDEEGCDRLLLDREVLQGLVPLAVTETRNASAFVHAVEAVHNILDRLEAIYAKQQQQPEKAEENTHTHTHTETKTQTQTVLPSFPSSSPSSDSKSLLLKSHLNHQALHHAVTTVADREEGTLGAPFARLRSVNAMRCYTSSMACLIVGGVYGVLRTAANPLIHPVVAYSVNGVGAVLLNVGYGNYGVRNWIKNHTYIEDDRTNALWTWGQAIVDVGVVTALLRKHPYSLLPVVLVNYLGLNSANGQGQKRLDGLDGLFSLG